MKKLIKINMRIGIMPLIGILAVSFLLTLGLSFFIFNAQNTLLKFTGFAVLNESSETGNSITNVSESGVVTKEDVLLALNESEQIIQEMLKNNFSILYMNDTLIEAKRIFQQAKYAEILRGDINSTEEEKSEARQALRFVDLEKISYADVLVYTDEIKSRKEKAFLLTDEIAVEEGKVNPEEEGLYNEGLFKSPPAEASEGTKQILEDAKTAFQEDRYQDVENLLEEFRNALEQETAELSTLAGIKKGAKNFFQRYWIHIIIVLILLSIMGYFAYKRFEKRILGKKIRKMRAESKVLVSLIKKAEIEAFKKETISEFIYNIRVKKYGEKLQEIKQELPVLEKRFEKLSKKLKEDKK